MAGRVEGSSPEAGGPSGPASSPTSRLVTQGLAVLFLAVLGGHSLLMLMGWDQLDFHYKALLLREHGLLPYRDYYEIQFFGTHLYHALIQVVGGTSDFGFRLFDLASTVFLCWTLWYTLRRLDLGLSRRETALLILLTVAGYYGLGWWWTGQRESFLLPGVFWGFFFVRQGLVTGRWSAGLLAGVATGLVFIIKPFYAVYVVVLLGMNLVANFPYPAAVRVRLRTAVLAALGWVLPVGGLAAVMGALGMLRPFVFDALRLGVEFKRHGSPLWWNLYHLVFRASPALDGPPPWVAMASSAALLTLAVGWLVVQAVTRDLRRWFFLDLLLVGSVTLMLYQGNGEVMNHHIPAVVAVALLAGTLIVRGARLVAARWGGDRGRQWALRVVAPTGLVVLLGVAQVGPALGNETGPLLRGAITVSRYRQLRYPVKAQEDRVVAYLQRVVDRERDEVMFFCYSFYIPYHARVRALVPFINAAFFIGYPKDAPHRPRLVAELQENFQRRLPKVVVVRTDDTWWARRTSFREWTTSYQELMAMPLAQALLRQRYRVALTLPSYVVFERRPDHATSPGGAGPGAASPPGAPGS